MDQASPPRMNGPIENTGFPLPLAPLSRGGYRGDEGYSPGPFTDRGPILRSNFITTDPLNIRAAGLQPQGLEIPYSGKAFQFQAQESLFSYHIFVDDSTTPLVIKAASGGTPRCSSLYVEMAFSKLRIYAFDNTGARAQDVNNAALTVFENPVNMRNYVGV